MFRSLSLFLCLFPIIQLTAACAAQTTAIFDPRAPVVQGDDDSAPAPSQWLPSPSSRSSSSLLDPAVGLRAGTAHVAMTTSMAPPGRTPAPIPPRYELVSYRGSLAIGDVIGVITGTLPLTGAIVHLIEGQPRHALASVGLRVGGIFVGGAAFYILSPDTCSPDGDIDCIVLVMAGGMIGTVVGTVLDYIYLSEKKVWIGGRRISLQPDIRLDRYHRTAGITARF